MNNKTVTKCECGNRMRKSATKCDACHKARMDFLKGEAMKVVATGKCPYCASPLVLNASLSGWYQCAGYASLPMRKPEYRNLPSCSFQTFTE